MSQVKGTEVRLETSPEQDSAMWVCWGNERGRQDKEHGRTFLHDILQLAVIVWTHYQSLCIENLVHSTKWGHEEVNSHEDSIMK